MLHLVIVKYEVTDVKAEAISMSDTAMLQKEKIQVGE